MDDTELTVQIIRAAVWAHLASGQIGDVGTPVAAMPERVDVMLAAFEVRFPIRKMVDAVINRHASRGG